ncbi:Fe-S-containing hydro-lyase [Planococcus liqunii]|uniref:Fe-S-containing hydro-lyase n=1 Tax=Planococcus liqunii TaxID=3058394 RepID=A0ABT8MRV0_9BACL|nr:MULTISPECIES: Fe-S-containing hydro-lyase [unclassified Planococcus (in: firmicutes)]MDN7227630.1 Fe-S-containing hydro-lyase [Planococcus sp. N064]WKA50511.1 Fe-S-containing hydro-lyase [Planococcus sp. N056]
MQKKITLPLTDADLDSLKAGDRVLLSGTVYTARDAAHKRMTEQEKEGIPFPIDVAGQVIYYTGPTPAKPGEVIGSAGPTTSGRMDLYTPRLLEKGLKGMIGKGYRNEEVKAAIKQHRAVYFGAVGGAAALIARSIKAVEVIAYEDLGTEAIRRLTIENFPVFVINDVHGGDIYEQGVAQFRQDH